MSKTISGMNERPILLTRPQAEAERSAHHLRTAGFIPHILPLSRTIACEYSAEIFDAAPYSALTVTSASAFAHVAKDVLKPLLHLPLFAVGTHTAQAARMAGFSQVIEGGGDAIRLAQTISQTISKQLSPQNGKLLYLAGKIRQPVFENALHSRGISCVSIDVYDTVAIIPPVSALGDEPFSAILFYSGTAARAFSAIEKLEHSPAINDQTRFIAISQRVADLLPSRWHEQKYVAAHPDEKSIFDHLSKI